MKTEIYIQGGTKNPATQKIAHARWKIVCITNTGAVETRDGYVAINNATTKRAVLTALRDALQRFNKAAVLKIYISDDYVRNALLSHWPTRWKSNSWHKIRLNGDIKHLDLWQQLLSQLSNHAVTFAKDDELENKYSKELEEKFNGRKQEHRHL